MSRGGAGAARVRPRRRGWGWLVALVVVVALAAVAWFVGEWLARDLVTKTVRDQVVSRLALPADQQVDVTVAGTVIPQLIAGRLDDVTAASDDVPLGDAFTGDVVIHATDVSFRGDASASTAVATVTLDQAQVQALMATVEDFPAATLGLAEPNVTVSTELVFFSARVPIAIALTPRAAGGDVVLTPAELRVGDAQLSTDDLRDRFGGLADGALRDWNVCVAQYLPAALTLSSVAVDGDVLTADLIIDPRVMTDAALQAPGTCA